MVLFWGAVHCWTLHPRITWLLILIPARIILFLFILLPIPFYPFLGGMPIIMVRGHLLGIEAFMVVLAWLLILAWVWSSSSSWMDREMQEWNSLRAFESSRAVSDALILSHHVEAWKGCAHFSEALQRVESYRVEKSCLFRLSSTPPISLLKKVSLVEDGTEHVYFSISFDENASCFVLRRAILVHPSNEWALLDVMSCA